ncbi:MAG: UTP--glucose-1-phosphate uridylyltransferase [Deltaproteobacteria bacterium]|nr:UTP--glucose-1-phosphate uridylyltransferase [Deltaproteobacteria bacterium]
MSEGAFKGNAGIARARFNMFYRTLKEFSDREGNLFVDELTNVEATRIILRLINYVLYGDFDFDLDSALSPIAQRANQIVSQAIKNSPFEEALGEIKGYKSIGRLVDAVRRAYIMALYAASPQVWLSDACVKDDIAGTERKVAQLLSDWQSQRFVIDSIERFVDEVLLSTEPLHVTYFIDDNGDLVYHLHLIEAFLQVNRHLSVTVVPKKGRFSVDASYSDVMEVLGYPEFKALRESSQAGKFGVLENGPEYPGINLRHISGELAGELMVTDVIFGLGQCIVEGINGLGKPAYLASVVDTVPHQSITGLPKGALYFARVPGGRKYFDDYTAKLKRRMQYGNTMIDVAGLTLSESVNKEDLKFGYRRIIRDTVVGDAELAIFEEEQINTEMIEPVTLVIPQGRAARQAESTADEALRQGKIAILTVAGGMSSRAGLSVPKGLFPIYPISQKSLFAGFAGDIRAFSKKYGKSILWFIMTSDNLDNDRKTREHFAENNYFGLNPANVIFIRQDRIPARESGTDKAAMKDEDTLRRFPNGHGGIYQALRDPKARSAGGRFTDLSAIEEAENRGVEHFLYHQVDNPINLINRKVIGYHLKGDSDFTMVLVKKRDYMEGLGLMAIDKATGLPVIVEYNQPAAEIIREKDGYQFRYLQGWQTSESLHR